MNYKLHKMVVATLAGSLVLGFGSNAMADGTFDLVQALVQKGVLTEEEALPLLKGHENDNQAVDKKIKKATRLTVSDAVDNATLYGDIRMRYEYRDGTGVGGTTGVNIDENRDRPRYKITMGVKTETGDWYTDLALAMGATGRSDNATFGSAQTGGTGGDIDNKQAVFIKRAMIGWKATDWLTLEAGRMNNPLYTTPMVWDADLNFEGLTEKVNYKFNNLDTFFTATQSEYLGDRKNYNGTGAPADTVTTELFAFQGGGKYAFDDHTSAKAALTFTTYSHNTNNTKFSPQLSTSTNTAVAATSFGVNDLDTIEIPAEFNYYVNSKSIGLRLFGDYVYNTSGSDRYNAAVASAPAGATRNAIAAAGNDDTAWMLGVAIGSASDSKSFEANKMVKGDWAARIWYQDVGAYSVDPNAVDSDYFDSRVNMQGVVFKAQYNFLDNVFANFAYGHGTRKNDALGSAGASSTQDIALNLKDFNLLQLDLTYKF